MSVKDILSFSKSPSLNEAETIDSNDLEGTDKNSVEEICTQPKKLFYQEKAKIGKCISAHTWDNRAEEAP